jgi:hypothetical protein
MRNHSASTATMLDAVLYGPMQGGSISVVFDC